MCSRFSRVSLVKALQHRFKFEDTDIDVPPEYNIAPTDLAMVVVQEGEKRILKRMMFGLIPHWAKDPKMGLHCLNARSETVSKLPSFREPFKKRRCLVLSDGFYEWKREGKVKTPYRIIKKSSEPFAMAGLWDKWIRPDGREFETFSIVTTEPNDLIKPFHDRMPVILDESNEGVWVAPFVSEERTLLPLLKPSAPEEMSLYEVSPSMNSSRNKMANCIDPI